MSSDLKHLIGVHDLSAQDIDDIYSHARDSLNGDQPGHGRRFTSALLFLSSSLRTRLGFGAATVALGGIPLDVSQLRWDPDMSASESLEDTIRTASGMADVLVTRTPVRLTAGSVARTAVCPVVNGGDADGEHPTQALIDSFAMLELAGPLDRSHVGISGDLTMRATRSLLKLFSQRPPARLSLIAPPNRRDHGVDVGPELASRTEFRAPGQVHDLDILYLPGLPAGTGDDQLDQNVRSRYAFSHQTMETLPDDAVVLSPLPVIDEVAPESRSDPRIRMWEANDLSVHVRIGVLRWLLDSNARSMPRAR